MNSPMDTTKRRSQARQAYQSDATFDRTWSSSPEMSRHFDIKYISSLIIFIIIHIIRENIVDAAAHFESGILIRCDIKDRPRDLEMLKMLQFLSMLLKKQHQENNAD
jgi:hypothetical protein